MQNTCLCCLWNFHSVNGTRALGLTLSFSKVDGGDGSGDAGAGPSRTISIHFIVCIYIRSLINSRVPTLRHVQQKTRRPHHICQRSI